MSDPPSARISRASSAVPDVAGKLGFVSMVTDACAGDAILVCPGRGVPSTVPFRWQETTAVCLTKSENHSVRNRACKPAAEASVR